MAFLKLLLSSTKFHPLTFLVLQPIQRLFFALIVSLIYHVYRGDVTDAYAHSFLPDIPTFMIIHAAYAN